VPAVSGITKGWGISPKANKERLAHGGGGHKKILSKLRTSLANARQRKIKIRR